MVVNRSDKLTLRIGRLELSRLGWALAISLAAHLLFWGGYEVSKILDIRLRLPQWAQRLIAPPPPKAKTPPPLREPYLFVDVSGAQAVVEPPKDAIRYSDRSAVAANPDANKNLNEPKIDGENEASQKTEDSTRRNKFDQLMPDPAPLAPKAQPKLNPGTMTVAKADLQPPQEHKRPRTVKEALLRNNQTPGLRSKQEGGAAVRAMTSYSVKGTDVGVYDRMFVDAVCSRWYDLLDNLSYDNWRTGRVAIEFTLNYKGEVTDVVILENTVSDMLALMCEKAIRDPAPFGEWPLQMRHMIGDSRRITFTFLYH
jgi:hypothetical protein